MVELPSKLLYTDENGTTRCWWCAGDPLYVEYHDTEWGFPVDDDFRLFEKVCLEGFQAGLSWLTILRKRENFRRAFKDFDFFKVARFNRRSVERLLKDASIVRHRGKIESTIGNARRAIELVEEHGSLAAFFWQFEPCSIGAGVVFWHGPMLIVFGMFVAGTMSVVLREVVLLRKANQG
jgi:DNA-3-methyladenine glycosylase I